MKKKYGPLPLWAWVVVIGGTIGVYLLYRSSSSGTSSTATTDQQLAAEQAAEEAAVGTTGGGSSGTTGSTDTSATDAITQQLQTNTDAIAGLDNDLNGFSTALATFQAGQPVTDAQTPVGAFAGEVGDVTDAVTAIGALASLFGAGSNSPGGLATPATTTKKAATLPALTASGAVRLPSGPTKPKAPAGYTSVGIGEGNWEGVPTISHTVIHATPVANSTTPVKKVQTIFNKPAPKAAPVSGKKKAK